MYKWVDIPININGDDKISAKIIGLYDNQYYDIYIILVVKIYGFYYKSILYHNKIKTDKNTLKHKFKDAINNYVISYQNIDAITFSKTLRKILSTSTKYEAIKKIELKSYDLQNHI